MEELVSNFSKERQRLLEGLKRNGIILPQTIEDTAVVDNAVLKRFVDTLKINGTADPSKKDHRTSDAIEWYTQLTAHYVFTMTLGSVLFLASYPWMALWWPPFYLRSFINQNSKARSKENT